MKQMGMTTDQTKQIWMARMQANNPRYSFLNATDQAAFNAKLEAIYPTVSIYLEPLLGAPIIDLNDPDYFNQPDPNSKPIPGFIGTTKIQIGVDKYGNPIYQIINTQLQQCITNTNNLNFYAGDIIDVNGNMSPNTNGLMESWQYDKQMTAVGPPFGATRLIRRIRDEMTLWNPYDPDQFTVNQYFWVQETPNLIIWVNKLDPTQQYKWLNLNTMGTGTPYSFNGVPLDTGLNSAVYLPGSPQLINSGWSLLNHDSVNKIWVWQFSYSDPTYKITINQQTNGSYKHSWSGAIISPNEWKDKYVGDQIA